MGGFTYPNGMVGTKRSQNDINALKEYYEITTHVILHSVNAGKTYETVMCDIFGTAMVVKSPLLWYQKITTLKSAFINGSENMTFMVRIIEH